MRTFLSVGQTTYLSAFILKINSGIPEMEMNFFELLGLQVGFPVAQYHLGDYRNLVYLCLDWSTKKAAIIDPQSDLEPIMNDLRAHGFTLTHCLLTHTHFDHIAGVPKLIIQYPEIQYWVHQKDLHRLTGKTKLKIPQDKLFLIESNQVIRLGQLQISALHTPGHSAGECCFYLEDLGNLNTPSPPSVPQGYLFTGDTLFVRDCGRTDIESGNNQEMFESLQKIKSFAPSTIILPGHCYQKEYFTVLKNELQSSPPLKCTSVKELAALP